MTDLASDSDILIQNGPAEGLAAVTAVTAEGLPALIAALEESRIVIYGAGFVAGMLRLALEKRGLSGNIACYVVSSRAAAEKSGSIGGVPVLALEDLQRAPVREKGPAVGDSAACAPSGSGAVICAAVHEALLPEIDRALSGAGRRALWIYPVLPDLLYGEAIRTDSAVPVRLIMEAQPEDELWVAARCAGVQACLTGEESWLELYLRAMSLHCGMETAIRRYGMLRGLVAGWASSGPDPAHPLVLDGKLRVIDGLHRLACACMLGTGTVPCRILPADRAEESMFDRVFTGRNRLTERALTEAGFDAEEIGRLRQLDRAVRAHVKG